jgi:hypothetical protein
MFGWNDVLEVLTFVILSAVAIIYNILDEHRAMPMAEFSTCTGIHGGTRPCSSECCNVILLSVFIPYLGGKN